MKQLHLFRSNEEPKPKPVEKLIIDTSLGPPSKEMGYEVYIKSEEWNNKRRYALYKADYRCQRCGRKERSLEVHHKHYDTLYREHLEDVQVLCVPCHHSADSDREYWTALETWAYKVYGEYWFDNDETRIQKEFDEWLEWKERENDY